MSHLARAFMICFVVMTMNLSNATYIEDVQKKYSNLVNSQDAFASFNLHMTKAECDSLLQFKIDKFDNYDNFGDPDQLQKQVEDFLKNLGNQDNETAQIIASLVTRLNQSIVQASQKETSWVCLRAFKKTDAYDQPRWHMDGGYYEPFNSTQFKFAMTLKGSGTLFYPLSPNERQKLTDFTSKNWQKIQTQFAHHFQQKLMTEEEIQNEKNKIYAQEEKNFLNQLVQNSQIVSLPIGQGMIFKVADSMFAALHSEPPIKEDRLFLSIVPCDIKDIEAMRQRLAH